MKNPHIIWATVLIVLFLVTGMVILIIMEKDVSNLLAVVAVVVTPVLSAFGVAVYQKMDQVKDQVNGNKTQDNKMIVELQQTVKELALRIPPPVVEVELKPTEGVPDVPEEIKWP